MWKRKSIYKEKMDAARLEVEAFLSTLTAQTTTIQLHHIDVFLSTSCRRKLKLPMRELKKFGDGVRVWFSFWSQFNTIHEDKEMEGKDKFQYLIRATTSGTRSREIVDGFPPTAENYAQAMDSLESRFGREGLLIEVYI
jgi:hypothetical protein